MGWIEITDGSVSCGAPSCSNVAEKQVFTACTMHGGKGVVKTTTHVCSSCADTAAEWLDTFGFLVCREDDGETWEDYDDADGWDANISNGVREWVYESIKFPPLSSKAEKDAYRAIKAEHKAIKAKAKGE